MVKYVIIISVLVSALVAGAVVFGFFSLPKEGITILEAEPTPVPTPLARYKIENLSKANVKSSEIEIKEVITEEKEYTSFLFEHKFDPTFSTGAEKTVTGQINIPNGEGPYPLVFMIRGYADQEIYTTGLGTRPGAAYFAEHGFMTIAPDFLGYGGSSSEAGDIYETRFQTYTTVMSLLDSIDSLEKFDKKNLFLWAHSNGGQVALSVLAITGRDIPTTLWAPVTKPFPYSVLYYTDQSMDGGKLIRRELSRFEELYDVDKFSFTSYLENINAPIQLHQGGTDDAIPVEWSDGFVAKMRALDKEVEYYKYPQADHNLRPDWDSVVARDVDFFAKFIQNKDAVSP